MDQAIVAKQSVFKGADAQEAYQSVWAAEKALAPPAPLRHVQQLFVQAARDEYVYLLLWEKESPRAFNRNHPLVNSASGRLVEGYNELMRLYPSENSRTKNAFFDYPRALDFK